MLLTQKPTSTQLDPVVRAHIVAHYRLAAPLLAPVFGGTPFAYGTYPEGFDAPVAWCGPLQSQPPGVPTCSVATARGVNQYLKFGAPAVRWALAHAAMVELQGWGCTASDPRRARFARIVLELDATHDTALALAARTMKHLLHEAKLQAIPLLEEACRMTLWIPLSGAPRYRAVRDWLYRFCANAGAMHPALFSLEPNAQVSGRVHLRVDSNEPGYCSALPYSLCGDRQLRVCTPLLWNELSCVAEERFTAANFAQRFAAVGDVFAEQVKAIGDQTLPQRIASNGKAASALHKQFEPQGRILSATAIVLRDGRPREVRTILAEALANRLLPRSTKEAYVYASLLEYIVRTRSQGRTPAIIQDADRRLRLSEPKDDWPPTDPPATPPVDAQTQGLLDRLALTAGSEDAHAFEIAVCDAFADIGFIVTHVGGSDNPAGYADAPLGSLGYRAVLECKSTAASTNKLDAIDARKHKVRYGAQVCALVSTGYSQSPELARALQTDGVSAWTVADLQQIVRVRTGLLEVRPLFEPGLAFDRVGDLLWNRIHGDAERVELACDYVAKEGWAAQVASAKAADGATSGAPPLTLDAATILVNRRLAEAGSSECCSRSDVSAAFDYLTSPVVGTAVRTNPAPGAGIVIVTPPP